MRFLVLVLCVLSLPLAGCASQAIRLRGVAPLNRNAEGESTPVDIRIYSLRDDDAFSRAGFAALWTTPGAALGGELQGQPRTVTVLPGEAGELPQTVMIDASPWVGVQALVRREDSLPRTLLIPAERLPGAVIEVTGYGLRLAGEQP
jgi:type VI secretion system VasD/TssJ family lipoprotein